MENIESLQAQLSLAGEIAVSHKNNILTDRIFLQISGRKQISAQQVINGTTVLRCLKMSKLGKVQIQIWKSGKYAKIKRRSLMTRSGTLNHKKKFIFPRICAFTKFGEIASQSA